MLNKPFYRTFCPWGACLGESPGSPFCPWVSKKQTFIFGTILERVIHQSAQPSNISTRMSLLLAFEREQWVYSTYRRVCLLYLYKHVGHLRRPTTRFTPSQREVMGSDRIHSSAFSGSGNQGFLGQHPVTMANHRAAQNYIVRGLNGCFPVVSDNCRGCDTLSLRNSRRVSQLPLLYKRTRLNLNS